MQGYDPNRARGGALPLHEAQVLFRDYLLPAERLLWAGRPRRGIRLSAAAAFLVPFSLLWGGFAIFWNVMVWAMDAPFFFRLFGLPFLVVGLYLIFGRFLHDAWVRGRTLYAVTNRRVLILRGARLVGRDIGRLSALEIEQSRGGRGSIRFEPLPFGYGRYSGHGRMPLTSRDSAFEAIEQPRMVYELIRREAERHRAEAQAL